MKTKITIRNICELVLQIVLISIGLTVPTIGNKSLFFVNDEYELVYPLGIIVFDCMLVCLIPILVQVASSKKSVKVTLFFSLLQALALVVQRIAVDEDYISYHSWLNGYEQRFLRVESEWTIILVLCIVQLGLCWIGYFALKEKNETDVDQPESTTPENATAVSAASGSIEDQLKECKNLFDSGLITEDEYQEKRKQILSI